MGALSKINTSKLYIGLSSLVNKGHSRSVKAKKNIVASVLVKGISVITSFVLVPLTIHYLNPINY
jgi:hypothetical protein